MTIKEVLTAGSLIPTYNNVYNSDDWFLHTHARLDSLLSRLEGKREIFEDMLEYTGHNEDPTRTLPGLVGAVDALFELNCYRYRHLWSLYVAEYNPLWNVDGTEKTTRIRKNTGTQENKASGSDSIEYKGSEATTRSGSESMSPEGAEIRETEGSITEAASGGPTESRTTFDSSTFYGTNKTEDTTKRETTYGKDSGGGSKPYKETTSYDDRTDTKTYNDVKDERSFDHREDKTTFGKTDTRTDNLTENETVIHERGGNIGVTMTTQLEEGELNFAFMFRFMDDLVSDIANAISYLW